MTRFDSWTIVWETRNKVPVGLNSQVVGVNSFSIQSNQEVDFLTHQNIEKYLAWKGWPNQTYYKHAYLIMNALFSIPLSNNNATFPLGIIQFYLTLSLANKLISVENLNSFNWKWIEAHPDINILVCSWIINNPHITYRCNHIDYKSFHFISWWENSLLANSLCKDSGKQAKICYLNSNSLTKGIALLK